MEDSILTSTKKVLGLAESYTAFDQDIITFINSTFAVIAQLGIGPANGFMITDKTSKWNQFLVSSNQLNLVRTLMFLKVRLVFDPPSTSYLIEAMNKQIAEFESRLTYFQDEEDLDPVVIP